MKRFFLVMFALASVVTAHPAHASQGASGADLLREVFRTQRPDGSFQFNNETLVFVDTPLLATIAWQTYRETKDAALLSQSAAAITRYYSHLFATRDTNGNLLLEGSMTLANGGVVVGVEDIGFNSLLALDLVSLAQLHATLRRPTQALFWYEGGRTLQDRLVTRYDRDTNRFLSMDLKSGSLVPNLDALALAPLLFTRSLGDNHIARMITHYALRPSQPGAAYDYLVWRPDIGSDNRRMLAARNLVRTAVVLAVLDRAGFDGESSKFLQDITAELNKLGAHNNGQPVATRYFSAQIESRATQDWFDSLAALDVYQSLASTRSWTTDAQIIKLRTDIAALRELQGRKLLHTDAASEELLTNVVRNTFRSVSAARATLSRGEGFRESDINEAGGMNLTVAGQRLLTDVVDIVGVAENRLFPIRTADTGLFAKVNLARERVAPGGSIELRWQVGSTRGEATLRTVVAQVGDDIDTVFAGGTLTPQTPVDGRTLFRVPDGPMNSLRAIAIAVTFIDHRSQRHTMHFRRSVFVERPVTATVNFPEGRIVKGTMIPVDVNVVKNVDEAVEIQGAWFCPSGLQMTEGNNFGFLVPASQDSMTMRYHLRVPLNARPGEYPFRLKLIGNEFDLGLLESTLFKAYQWVAAGPFGVTENPMRSLYPPESEVDLGRNYSGVGGRVRWQPVPDYATNADGIVSLAGLLHRPGVGYLYTLFHADGAKELPMTLMSNTEAALFVNGDRVVEFNPIVHDKPEVGRASLRPGLNKILVKVAGDRTAQIALGLPAANDLLVDEINNNLWEIMAGYPEFHARSQQPDPMQKQESQQIVTFRFVDQTATTVSVIGSFNGWSPSESVMKRGNEGLWELVVSLPPGRYSYRFLVDNRRQLLDPMGTLEEPDGYGGKNSVIVVTDD